MDLHKKLLLIFLVVSVIPIVSVGVISFNISKEVVLEAQIKEKLIRLESIRSSTSDKIREKLTIGISFFLEDSVQYFVNQRYKEHPEIEKRMALDIRRLMYNHSNIVDTHSIYMYTSENMIFTNRSITERQGDIELLKKYFDTDQYQSRYLIGGIIDMDDEFVIPFIRVLTPLDSLEPKGVLIVNLKESYFSEIYRQYETQDIGNYCITDNNDIIISHSDQRLIGKNIKEVYGFIFDSISDNKPYFTGEKGGEKYFVVHLYSEESWNWKFYSISKMYEIMVGANYIKRTTLLLGVMLVIICVFIAVTISRGFTQPIEELIRVMKSFENGTLNLDEIPKFKNEIGLLSNSFERMIKKLNLSIEEKILFQKEKREAELRVLEFQINPHFLYNTLSSIVWLANAGQNEDVITIAKSLSDLFRISISRGKEIIYISDEVAHVKNYIDIEQIRHQDEFFVIYEIDVNIYRYKTIKLILQPIVENAINHGIRMKTEGRGILKLQGRLEEKDIVFRIMDNGNSLTNEKIREINEEIMISAKGKDTGIGIRNVHDRIRLTFGENYGITVGREDLFTVVEIKIPALSDEETDV